MKQLVKKFYLMFATRIVARVLTVVRAEQDTARLAMLAAVDERLTNICAQIDTQRTLIDETTSWIANFSQEREANALLKLGHAEMLQTIDQRVADGIQSRMYIPNLLTQKGVLDGAPFMQYSTCSSADFLHPRYLEICDLIKQPPIFHRKV